MSHDVIWKLADREALRREIALVCARAPRPAETSEHLFTHFMRQLQSHPLQWPSSPRLPSEHTWRAGGGILVRYRLIPDAQTVEVLSVTGRHAPSDAR
jgi:hypothetical protein